MLSEAPPCSEDFTTSLTWADFVDVNALTSSGISAPARVPHEMMMDSCHQRFESTPLPLSRNEEHANVSTIDTTEVIHTSELSGFSKSKSSVPYERLAQASLTK